MVSALEFVRQYNRKRKRRPLMNLDDRPVVKKRKRGRKSQKTVRTLSRAKSVRALLDREPWLTIQELAERTGSTYQQTYATLKYLGRKAGKATERRGFHNVRRHEKDDLEFARRVFGDGDYDAPKGMQDAKIVSHAFVQ